MFIKEFEKTAKAVKKEVASKPAEAPAKSMGAGKVKKFFITGAASSQTH